MEGRLCFVLICTFFIVLIANSANANAQCQTACPYNYQPVCGRAQQNSKSSQSEFRTFPNQCDMDAENCRNNGNKKWELFSSEQCPETTVTNRPEQSKCNSFCPLDYSPVCGRSGTEMRTFPNRCSLTNEQCKSSGNKKWELFRSEECPETTVTNRPERYCDTTCAENYSPVCGKNRNGELRTFSNRCLFTAEKCKNPSWTYERDGQCVNSKSPLPTPFPTTEIISCNSFCPADFRPVCGRNGNELKTFPNRCNFDNEKCKFSGWTFEKEGQCSNTKKKCRSCSEGNARPVCGTNGNEMTTFPSRCSFRNAQCKSPAWKFVRSGVCVSSVQPQPALPCGNSFCTADYRPVCGKNGYELKTFPNRCSFTNEQCKSPEWKFVREGECVEPRITSPRPSDCNTMCPANYDPVCGRSGNELKTFPNRCSLTNDQCKSSEWKFVREGECLETPITSPRTSECNSICPANYDPVCGRNENGFNTFSNRCSFDNAKCNLSSWTFVRDGNCNAVTITNPPTKGKYNYRYGNY